MSVKPKPVEVPKVVSNKSIAYVGRKLYFRNFAPNDTLHFKIVAPNGGTVHQDFIVTGAGVEHIVEFPLPHGTFVAVAIDKDGKGEKVVSTFTVV